MKAEKKFKNTFWFTVYHAVKKNFVIPLLGMLGASALLISTFYKYSFITKTKELAMQQNNPQLLADFRKTATYAFFNSNYALGHEQTLFSVIFAVTAIVLGIMLFRFVTSKNTVNVYYSLGIKRAELYSARYLAGVLMLLPAVIVPLLTVTLINMYWFGSSAVLWKTFIFYVIHFSVTALAVFSMSASVSSAVGTVSEATIFSTVLTVSPTVLLVSIENMLPLFLKGIGSGVYYCYGSYKWLSTDLYSTPFGKRMSYMNPLALNTDNAFADGMNSVLTQDALKAWRFPSLAPYILWTVGIAAFFVLGLLMFKHRKAELCGCMGRNRLLNIFTSFILAFPVLVVILTLGWSKGGEAHYIKDDIAPWTTVLIGVALAVVIFCLIELILLRNFKLFKKEVKFAGIAAAIMLAATIPIETGVFGYDTRIPDAEDIESAAISMPETISGADAWLPATPNYVINYDDAINYYLYGKEPVVLGNLQSKRDIEFVRDVHKSIADSLDDKTVSTSGPHSRIAISYKLKNGTVITREYTDISVKAWEKIFAIEDTDRWNAILDKRYSDINTDKIFNYIFSKQMSRKTPVDPELVSGLMQAALKDIKNLSYKSFWKGEGEYLGSIVIFDMSNKEEQYWEEHMQEAPSVYTIESSHRYDSPEESWSSENKENENTYLLSSGSAIQITTDMVNTIAFLKEHSLYDALSDTSPIVKAKAAKLKDPSPEFFKIVPHAPIFCSFWDDGKAAKTNDEYRYYSGKYSPRNAVEITDRQLLSQLEKNAYGVYLDSEHGYVVEFFREDGSSTIMYVPNGRVNIGI